MNLRKGDKLSYELFFCICSIYCIEILEVIRQRLCVLELWKDSKTLKDGSNFFINYRR